MAKTGYRVTWVPQSGTNIAALKRQHNRAFPGNELSIVKGFVKVSVMNEETADSMALDLNEVMVEWEKIPDPVGPGGR